MKRMLAFLVLSLVLVGSNSALAQHNCTSPNIMAITFDTDAEVINLNDVETYEQITAYVYLLNADNPCVGGFETGLVLPPELTLLSVVFSNPQALNVGDGNDFIVGFGSIDSPDEGTLQLMTLTLLYTGNGGESADIFLAPTDPASIDGQMAYLGCDSALIPVLPLSGGFELPVARINGDYPLEYCLDTNIDGFTVQISSQGDTENIVGCAQNASDGFDYSFDLPEDDIDPAVFFFRPEWSSPLGDYFRQDIVALYDPLEDLRTWSFVVQSVIPEGETAPYPVQVDFLPSFADEPGIILTLVDKSNDEITILEAPYQHQYSIYNDESRTFELTVGNDTVYPPAYLLDVVVNVTSNDLADLGNHAAAADWATDYYDEGIDLPEPGPPPGQYLVASFYHPGWPFGPRFRNMVHGTYDTSLDYREWPLRVETDQEGIVQLDFAPDFDEASGTLLYLRDEQTNQVYNLFPELSYSYENENPSIRDFTILMGNQGPPEMSPPNRWLREGWNLIALPQVPDPGQNTFENLVFSQLLHLAYAFGFAGDTGYLPVEPNDAMVYGQGYWLAIDEFKLWSMAGTMALDPVDIALDEGWNLVGYPMWFNGDVENIQVNHNQQTFTWQQAVESGLVAGTVIHFNTINGMYEEATLLENYTAYWFAALTEGISLEFYWENFTDVPWDKSHPRKDETPAKLHWRTEVSCIGRDGKSNQISFGVHPKASEGFDPDLDVPRAPSAPNRVGYFGLLRPEWQLPTGPTLFRELMAPEGDDLVWNAEILTEPSNHVTLRWSRQEWPSDLDLQVYLPDQNRVVLESMQGTDTLRLPVPDGYLKVQFRTPRLSGVEDIPTAGFQLSVHPNPFNPQTTISFDLARSGQAEVRIFTVRGEMVQVLNADNAAVGRNQVIWTGKDRAGREVPSGSYFAKLYLDGQAVGPVSKMSLVR